MERPSLSGSSEPSDFLKLSIDTLKGELVSSPDNSKPPSGLYFDIKRHTAARISGDSPLPSARSPREIKDEMKSIPWTRKLRKGSRSPPARNGKSTPRSASPSPSKGAGGSGGFPVPSCGREKTVEHDTGRDEYASTSQGVGDVVMLGGIDEEGLFISGGKRKSAGRVPSPSSFSGFKRPKRKTGLVDSFTEGAVKDWSEARVSAWNGRKVSPDQFYYRFVDPTVGQRNGEFTQSDHQMWMERYNEFLEQKWTIGTSWGLFSKAVTHKCGYQCANYYRKLLEKGALKDPSYDLVGGKLKKNRSHVSAPSHCGLQHELSNLWKVSETEELAQKVDMWVKNYHPASASARSPRTPGRAKSSTAGVRSSRPAKPPPLPDSSMFWQQNASLLTSLNKSKKKAKKQAGPKQLDLSNYFAGVKPPPPKMPPPEKVQVPKPVPRSWAKRIAHDVSKEVPVENARSFSCTLDEIGGLELGTFDAILMDPPWEGYYHKERSRTPEDDVDEGTVTIDQLATLPIERFMKSGLLLIWTEKSFIAPLVKVVANWGFHYVENFVWVLQAVNNSVTKKDSPFVRRSKLSLLIFRKDGDLSLRHQRTADVVFDFEKANVRAKPTEAYRMIETMLPDSLYDPVQNHGRLLHLWAPKSSLRSGWTSVSIYRRSES